MKALTLMLFLIALLMQAMSTMAKQSNQPSSVFQQTGVETHELYSKLMKRQIPYGVVLPTDYETNKAARFPVIYLLHGGGGSYQTYLLRPKLIEMFRQHKIIVVAVEGGVSFYTDSATVPDDKYESYIVQELIREVDKNFRTVAERNGRAVAGPSMGGYGALKLGVKYPQMFALVCSWSGGVIGASWLETTEKAPSTPKELKDALLAAFGAGTSSSTIEANDLMKLFSDVPADKVAGLPFFYLDCGTEDDFGLLKPNRQLTEVMLSKKIAHEYREFPGGHRVEYPSRFPYLLELSDRLLTQASSATNEK